MSLINEALKKLNSEKPKAPGAALLPAEAPQAAFEAWRRVSPPRAVRRRPLRGWLLIGALALIAGGALLGLQGTGARVILFAGPAAFTATFNEVLPPGGLDPAATAVLPQGQMKLWGQVPAGVFAKSKSVETRPAPSAFRLSGTVAGTQTRAALVNDRWVEVGDSIDGARVQEILAGEVVLNRQGREIRLEVA